MSKPALADLLKLPDDALLRDFEAAVVARLSTVTLARHRTRGTGPAYRRAGPRRVLYEKGTVLRWIAGQEFLSTTQEGYGRKPAAEARANA